MKKVIIALVVGFVCSTTIASSATAGPATSTLITCLSDNTSGKDRKDLARWVFVGMAAHPEIKSLSKVTEADRDEINQKIATMVTRLLTEDCRAEAQAAMEKDGPMALHTAFSAMGELAMQELTTNAEVKSAFANYSRYLDQEKFNAAFSTRAGSATSSR